MVRREKSGEVFKLINKIIKSVKNTPIHSRKNDKVRRIKVNEHTATGGWY